LAKAADAIRVVNESARLVSTIGTRAPRTSPEVDQLLGQHVAGLKIGHEQNVGVARDWRDDALLTGGIRVEV
jgi:hypothetical protein